MSEVAAHPGAAGMTVHSEGTAHGRPSRERTMHPEGTAHEGTAHPGTVHPRMPSSEETPPAGKQTCAEEGRENEEKNDE